MADCCEIYKNGFAYHQAGDLDNAEKCYVEVLNTTPDDLNTIFMMANLKYQQYRYNEAEKLVLRAMELATNVRFYDLLTRIRIENGRYQEAIDTAVEGLEIEPSNFELNFNIALALKKNKEYELALKFYQRAEKLSPDMAIIPFNMSSVYFYLGEPKKSTEMLEKALKLAPNNDELKYFLSLSYFRERNYRDGFQLFESRLCKKTATKFQMENFPKAFAKAKEWSGEDIAGKTVYMYYEAGYGDVIQYARYFPLLKERCGKLLFKSHEELVELFKENSLGVDEYVTYLTTEIDFDYYVPMMSLPYLLGLNEDNMFVSKDGYLQSNLGKRGYYKLKYFSTDKIKIGIKWQGNTASETDRVIDINAFKPLFEIPNTQFYSFQTGLGSEKLEELQREYSIVDLGNRFKNFSDTASALDNLDFVICNDTSLLHLAGALNKSAYMLLPFDYNWRWHSDLSKNDWYTSVKMYRQNVAGSWDEPMQKLIFDLQKDISEK